MKKLVLLFVGALMTLTTTAAAEKITATTQGEDLNRTRYSYAQPIQFVERGVEFLIFPDGSFDFNTNLNYTEGDSYYRQTNSRRGSINATFGAPGTRIHYSRSRIDRGVIVRHDRDGKVRRVGNVFVNYNRYDQVKRLGSVYIGYNRYGWVNQVGGLHIRYNRRGRVISISGYINRWNQDCGISINNGFDGHDDDWYDDDDDFYYYKKNGKTKKHKKLKAFKRDDD